jgi:capsular exopolysaccharide synthesis family protein
MKKTPAKTPRQPADYGGSFPYAGGSYGAPVAGVAVLNPRRMLARWRTLALVLAFAALAAIGYLRTASNVYQAASLIEMSARRPRILAQQAAVIEEQSSQSAEVFNTRLERFKGRTMLQAALARLDAACPGMFRLSPGPSLGLTTAAGPSEPDRLREERLRRFESALTLTLVRRSRLIRAEFEYTDPVVAAAACNAFAEAAEASAFDENRGMSDAAVAWLEAQAKLQRQELLKAEDALLAFRKQNEIDVLESQRKTVEDALLEFSRALVGAESRETEKNALLSKMGQLKLDPEEAGKLPAGIPRADEIGAALAQWRLAVVERDSLLGTLTPKHPEVQVRDKIVALRRDQAMEALKRAAETAQADHALLMAQAAALRKKMDAQAQLATELEMRIVERKTRLGTLERARDAADQSFRGILTRIEEARMAADENTATVKVVERAVVPTRPVRPQPLRVLSLALLLGFVGGVALIVVSDFLEDRVTGPEDFEGGRYPILAVVPHVGAADRASVATAVIRQRFDAVVESFAGIGAMLDSPRYKDRAKVILVASSVPAEGKTVASCNLAATLARKGRRVLLVDFDLRRPRLAGILSMPPGLTGLLDALSHPPVEFDALPFAVDGCPGLEVIASRPVHGARPVEAMGMPAARDLIAWARQKYDHVVLDAPPVGPVSDALALAPMADMTLVMVRPEISRKRLTQHTLYRLRESGIEAVALVVNDLDGSKLLYRVHSPYCHYQRHYKTYQTPEKGPRPTEGRNTDDGLARVRGLRSRSAAPHRPEAPGVA